MSNEVLFRLKMTKGIGNIGILNIMKAAQTFDRDDFTEYELAHYAGLNRTKNQFLNEWWQTDEEKLEEARKHQQFITFYDEEYSELLREIYNPPAILFYRGDLSLLKKPCLSVVGARDASLVGQQTVHHLITPLIQDYVIVSGLADGIDGIAHKVALGNHGKTIGVIGNGLDISYPRHHGKLQEYMAKHQLVLSEYPNGTSPAKHHFPERNRIIAGLSLGTVVVEAKLRSGSLITCERALESGREVFAVPGDVLSGKSNGCHALIQEGAKCTFQTKDILDELLKS
ncbi:MAG: DNA-processing protein DprA [Lactobacillales bacterium]|nr:DNA-processing protein DprA [Lactobacillales bacterium]